MFNRRSVLRRFLESLGRARDKTKNPYRQDSTVSLEDTEVPQSAFSAWRFRDSLACGGTSRFRESASQRSSVQEFPSLSALKTESFLGNRNIHNVFSPSAISARLECGRSFRRAGWPFIRQLSQKKSGKRMAANQSSICLRGATKQRSLARRNDYPVGYHDRRANSLISTRCQRRLQSRNVAEWISSSS